jgi:hypothetical protein
LFKILETSQKNKNCIACAPLIWSLQEAKNVDQKTTTVWVVYVHYNFFHVFIKLDMQTSNIYLFVCIIVRAEMNASGSALAVDALSQVKHVLLPITDRNPYLSEGTRQVQLLLQNVSTGYFCF